jgi:hypothetical protein
VLEDDAKLRQEIDDAIRKTDTQSQIRYFNSLEDFQKWIMIAVSVGQQALFQGGQKLSTDPNQITASGDVTDELLLLISKEEWLGSRYVKLIRKTIETFIRKSICTKEDPTRIVITAFESHEFDFKLVEDPVITNIIFKPFDQLILQQQLHFALKGHHKASEAFVHNVQTEQQVEMTKEVQMEAVGDVGFVTRSPRPIDVGQISKYYGDVFKSTGRTHIMGRCIACEPHPEMTGQFRVWFSYFGLPSTQISDIRKAMVKRNEIEFSANAPFQPQRLQMDWIILDPHKDRVAKYKKILHNVAEAQIKVFSSFDEFVFQSDPLTMENSRKEAPWTDSEKITLHIDQKCEKVLKILPEAQESKKIFGESFKDFGKASFLSKLIELSQHTLKHWAIAGSADHELLVFKNAGQFFTVKVSSFVKHKSPTETYFEIELCVPSSIEKTAWMEQKFPTLHMAHAILISEEFMSEERLAYWEEFVRIAKEKGGSPRFMGLYHVAPDEKFTRKLHWMEEIFEDDNDAPYVERKLKWQCGKRDVTEGHTVFINSCNELIRVANPVDVAELSEAALTLNYRRAIDPGEFRKFVLSRTGETYQEYRAVCNYSVEHPSEKDMFQSHFVFFGITDGHLKYIRIWILENFVQSKQEEGA